MNKQVVGEIMMLTLAVLPFLFIVLEGVLLKIKKKEWRDIAILTIIYVWGAVGAWLILS